MCRRLILLVSVVVPVGLPLMGVTRADYMVASNPSPRNGESAVDINADLYWLAGDDANGHDVYFGTIFNDVDTATRASTNGVLLSVKQADSNYQLSTLSLNTSYHWRIDEVNDYNIVQWPGEVWSFTTHTVPPDPNLTGWWRFEEGSGTTCVDSSNNNNTGSFGVDANGNPDSNNAPQWTGGRRGEHSLFFDFSDGNDFVTCGNDAIFDVSGPFTVMAWIKGPFNGVGKNTIIGKGSSWRLYMLGDWGLRFSICIEEDVVFHVISPGLGPGWHHVAGVWNGSGAQLYYNGELVDSNIVTAAGCTDTNDLWIGGKDNGATGEDWWMGHIDDVRIYDYNLSLAEIQSIYNEPYDIAHDPNPGDGATVVLDTNALFSMYWTAGVNAISHNVYFGTCDPPPFVGNQSPNSYEPNGISEEGGIDFSGIYYWKIDEVTNNDDVNIWHGPVWSLSVADYLLIDDFESYNTHGQLDDVWDEQGPVYVHLNWDEYHGGTRSMKLMYYNGCGFGSSSEANNTYGTAQDWTKANVKALTMYFLGTGKDLQGVPNNDPDKLFVLLADGDGNSAVVTHPDNPNAITEPVLWQEWNIDLQKFKYPTQAACNNVNLANIKTIIIGVGDRYRPDTGNPPYFVGEVSFDDIRLYRSRCVTEYKPAADFTGDCVVDYNDIRTISRDWLNTTAAPNDANLLGYWKFDGDSTDSSSNGNHGTLVGDGLYGGGKYSRALGFDGNNDYVNCGNDVIFDLNTPFSIMAWVKRTGPGGNESQTIITKGSSAFRLYTVSSTNSIVFACTGLDDNTPNACDPNDSVTGQLDVTDGQWHHIAGVYDGSNIYVYADGVPTVQDVNDSCSPSVDANEVWIGANRGTSFPKHEWEGLIDEVRIYDYALSEAEIDYLAGLQTDLNADNRVNFKDIAELGKAWLDEQLWP